MVKNVKQLESELRDLRIQEENRREIRAIGRTKIEKVKNLKRQIFAIKNRKKIAFASSISRGVSSGVGTGRMGVSRVAKVVDEEEARYLLDRIQGDGVVDANERALLTCIRTTATSVHSSLASFIEEQGC